MSESNGRCAFIPDGYMRDGFIEATDFHPAVKFVYRPTTITERTVINGTVRCAYAKMTEEGFAESELLGVKALANHIHSWDVQDPDGNVVDVTTENALLLEPKLFTRMYSILMVESVSDKQKETDAVKNSAPG